MNFSNLLTTWYLQNKRDLPWRKTTNPYHIWLSEIMLQQTRVAQGLPYYLSFTKAFPTVFDLANAHEEEVLKLWQGLGYYSRARNLHNTAKYVASELNGIFPDNYKSLLSLKGVGEYTAAAIASFSYNEIAPVVDGNVYRVLSRYFGIETDISSPKAKKEFTALASELIDKQQPAAFNQAIMEFGALQCVPKNPNCDICPLNTSCWALANKKVALLPVKEKKTKVTHRYFNYLLVIDPQQKTIVHKRTQKGIWHNLYEFPVIETEKLESTKTISELIQVQFPETDKMIQLDSETVLHKLSHQHLHIHFWKIHTKINHKNGLSYNELVNLPVPIVIHNFIERNSF
ncbi:A/G-specific adenine glycosylase [Flavobacterium amnicola]|uniref:Adenine DNA glycosylase n=1 Tax=Flavobacterium amnicola TaxID=2506422 RepID=A0A4Q1K5F7_9FLAO|nr:A/G-specific adenine glycosylase [Flavobacterium amnicola]RXR20730.1 A/G-specific adenine glycosylase [Flavobacterium amnicola]